jgi:hypothetical protein
MDRQKNNGILITQTRFILLQGLNHNSDAPNNQNFDMAKTKLAYSGVCYSRSGDRRSLLV